MSAISEYHQAAKKYEERRLQAIAADAEPGTIKQLFANVGKSFPAIKKDLYPGTKNGDLAYSFFKDWKFRREMRRNFEKWAEKEVPEDKESVHRKTFISMCQDLEKTCLVFDQFHEAKEAFKNQTNEKISQGVSFQDIQKEIGDFEYASRRAYEWYQKSKS